MAPEPDTLSDREQRLNEIVLEIEKARDAGQVPDGKPGGGDHAG